MLTPAHTLGGNVCRNENSRCRSARFVSKIHWCGLLAMVPSSGASPRFVERPGPALERSLREHPLRLQSGIADADLVLGIPQLTPVAPHLGIDRIVGLLDLGALSHASPRRFS